MMRWQQAGFGLYVHWPFCQSKCPYCDFNSHVAGAIDQDEWAGAYISELDRLAAELPNRVLRSIFFGGGTPSLMAPALVEAIIRRATDHWPAANDIEITLEANPTSVEIGRFSGFRAAGVNRVSLGVQALNDTDLRRLGRLHDVQTAKNALDIARKTFDRFSFDLIYARQDQSIVAWRDELDQALDIAGDHLSLYQLTIEENTVFGARHERGLLHGLPSEDLGADMFLMTQELCATAGLPAYEVSNHARAGHESRHNMIYWRGGDYAGIGPGAHGRITDSQGARRATVCEMRPETWLAQVQTQNNGESSREIIDQTAQSDEFVMMGLRLSAGVSRSEYAGLSGKPLPESKIVSLCAEGFLRQDGDQIAATIQGRLLLNKLIETLLT